ncbi:MAG TPA: DUF1097 domain-containing protein [Pseudoduganella sp.]|jgi:hypothetical protein
MNAIVNAPAAVPARTSFIGISASAAAVAAIASGASVALALPVWAMFIGWIAYFTHGGGLRQALEASLCVALGIALGMLASMALSQFGPILGVAALPVVVFVIAMVVVSLRGVAPINNIPAYFLGLVAHFAAHLTPTVVSFVTLGSAGVIGAVAGWLAHRLQRRFN